MGLGIAKVHEHSIAHILRYEPAEALHSLGNALLICRNDLVQVGSMRAESAVEPTRSENITVTWRRSAVSWAFGVNAGCGNARTALESSWIERCIFSLSSSAMPRSLRC
jgi:hypothetical protein